MAGRRAARNALRAVVAGRAGSLLLWASAKIQVPFYPVPMTFQTAVVLLIGIAYGWRLAVATLLLYLAQGAVGLPVFAGTPAKGIGLPYMLGPTGGYSWASSPRPASWAGSRSAGGTGSPPWPACWPGRRPSTSWVRPGSPASSAPRRP